MKTILILCTAAALASACINDPPPVYGPEAVVCNPYQAQEALDQGSVEVIIRKPLDGDATLAIPNIYPSGTAISITVDGNGKSLTITQGAGNDNYPYLRLILLSPVANLNLNTPGMPATVDGDVGGTLTASTALLTISGKTDVEKLAVEHGDVRLLGTAAAFGDVAPDSDILYPVSTVDDLRNRISVTGYDHVTNGGAILTNDLADITPADGPLGGITGAGDSQDLFHIGISGESDPSWDGYTLDGNGFSLSGAAYNNILAVYADNVTVCNLTVLQTDDQKAAQIEKSGMLEPAYNTGISVYKSVGVALLNIHAHDCGKYGAVINGSTAMADGFTSAGNRLGGINVTQGGGVTEIPDFTLVSGDITDEPAIYVDVETFTVSVPAGWTSESIFGYTIYSPPAD